MIDDLPSCIYPASPGVTDPRSVTYARGRPPTNYGIAQSRGRVIRGAAPERRCHCQARTRAANDSDPITTLVNRRSLPSSDAAVQLPRKLSASPDRTEAPAG